MQKIKVMTIFGTRPEAIKIAPLIKALENDNRFESIITITAQHREMLDQVLDVFEINPDFDLNIMEKNQTLADITSNTLLGLNEVLSKVKSDIILVHGDTTTTFSASLAGFYHQIKIGHVEAGLRSWNKFSPFPEEINRQITDMLTDLYFVPTLTSKKNLLLENRNRNKIYITGNTAIDAMKYTVNANYKNDLIRKIGNHRMILVTMHRRENFGQSMINVFRAINRLVKKHKDVEIVFPIHKSPKVRELAKLHLIISERAHIIEPLNVIDFQNFMSKSYFIMSDSGGVQEEASSLGKPVLVLRNTTERPEGVSAGVLKLVGTEEEKVFHLADVLLTDKKEYIKMSKISNLYGDGNASKRIINSIAFEFGMMDSRPKDWCIN
ncbi:MAG: UDP-N-acetylglucosamine 2-epimerase (non-hydrolyzing) [Lactobacillales bacterium]|nr:UDP-N-acetylglucosamine 2-epimerase (non-hydrolyzing) [Lactobacillales bacterium]